VLSTPFGKLAAPNITPDAATGIGNWTRDDFDAALRQGKGHDGMPLYPAMPYMHYTQMTASDVDALWSYVKSLEPVSNKVKVNRLPFPFDIRTSLYLWQTLYFEPGRFEPDPAKSEIWNRGAYLTQALGHCGACHTPRDALGGPMKGHALEGARIEEWFAPDISNGPGSVIADWDVGTLKAWLAGTDGGNHAMVGSMRDVVKELKQMSDDDLLAIATYLKDQPEKSGEPATTAAAEAQISADTAELYKSKCQGCHGADGRGTPGIAASLVDTGAVLAEKPHNVISVLLEGIGPDGKYGVMPSFRSLSDTDIARLANYVRSSWENDAPATAGPDLVSALRRVTESDPAALKAAYCPNVAAHRADAALQDRIAELAAHPRVTAEEVDDIAGRYDALNPDASREDRMHDLGSLMCQAVARTGAGKSTVILRELELMDALSKDGDAG
jgi:mono/diheme cytochrome c family protein